MSRDRLDMRVRTEDRVKWELAAEARKMTLSEWIRDVACREAGLLVSEDEPSRPSEKEKAVGADELVEESDLPSEEMVLPSGDERAIRAVADEIHKRGVLDRVDKAPSVESTVSEGVDMSGDAEEATEVVVHQEKRGRRRLDDEPMCPRCCRLPEECGCQ